MRLKNGLGSTAPCGHGFGSNPRRPVDDYCQTLRGMLRGLEHLEALAVAHRDFRGGGTGAGRCPAKDFFSIPPGRADEVDGQALYLEPFARRGYFESHIATRSIPRPVWRRQIDAAFDLNGIVYAFTATTQVLSLDLTTGDTSFVTNYDQAAVFIEGATVTPEPTSFALV